MRHARTLDKLELRRSNMIWFVAVLALLSLLGGLIYRRAWIRLKGAEQTPTGFGALLAIVLVAGEAYLQAPADLIWSYILIAMAAAVYWYDDIAALSAKLRLLIQFGTGFAVCSLLLAGFKGDDAPLLMFWCVLAGLLNVVLTNVVNFSDGADLNVATTMLLIVGMILLIGPDAAFMRGSAFIVLAFVLAFAVLNCRPNMLYFGDSGCFVFTSFLTVMTVCYFRNAANSAAFAAIPIAFPVFDEFYVFVTRVRNREDLLTRNFLHLYQKLQTRYQNFAYLLPQLVNVILVVIGALVLQSAGLPALFAVILAMLLITPVFYAFCRMVILATPRTSVTG
jgi:UDP-N-acetylmuramyl pentapeptide phosphotransferase/UDP-N-acetylglucosamine-1-phosphate transferase